MNDQHQQSEQAAASGPNPGSSEIAKAFSSLGASKGGKARALALSPEERSAIARRAVEARWLKAGKVPVPRATHAGVLEIGNAQIPCYVLEDGQRIISTRGIMGALGRRWRGRKYAGTELPVFLEARNLKTFIDNDLSAVLSPIIFEGPRGLRGEGFKAEVLPKVCEVYMKARDADGILTEPQQRVAKQAEILMRGLAHVGITALVDEATGYQADRARDALAKILEAFIAKELRAWVRTFEPEFYQELFRLRGIEFKGTLKAPRFIGKLTNDLVYDRLAPGIRDELNRINPNNEKGQRKHKNFQWLTQQVGYQKLKQHLAAVTALMKAFDDWDTFKKKLDRALPRQTAAPLFDVLNDEGPGLSAGSAG